MYEFWIFITASLIATSCALVGSLLILRRMSMLGDAISHSVLLGIVLVYLLFGQTNILWLLSGAVLIGLLTAWLSEWVHQKAAVPSDASLGLVFTWLFALAIVLIAVYADNVHLDHDHVLFGEMAFIPFNNLQAFEINWGPKAFWLSLSVLLINLLVIGMAFERFKLSSFHPLLATTLGISAAFWHYVLMSLVSITAVASFDAVGSILVVALLVIPASTAYLFANSLSKILLYAVLFAQASVLIGLGLAAWLDSAISASMGVAAGLILLISLMVKRIQQAREASRLASQA